MNKIWTEGRELLEESSWRSEQELSRVYKTLHFCVLVWRSFSRNRCPVRAAALAYTTLLALIPMLAVALSISSSFLSAQGEEQIDHFAVHTILQVIPRTLLSPNEPDTNADFTAQSPGANTNSTSQQSATTGHLHRLTPSTTNEVQVLNARREIARRIHEFIRNTRSSALGVTGSLALIFTAISMLSTIETTFNDIWGVSQGRGWFLRVVVYWTVISLAPLLLALAIGLTTGSHWQSSQKLVTHTPAIAVLFFRFLPLLLLCLALTGFYRFMPNTKVHWNAALVGGVIAGLLWHLNSLVSVMYVSRVVTNSKIYGSLGLIPVIMIGLYFSWWILLFGSQVAYAFQNRASFMEQRQVETIDQRGRELIALRIMARVGRRFLRGEPPPTVFQMGKELNVPTRLIQELLHHLCAARLAVQTTDREPGYLPGRPLEQINCHQILAALRAIRGQQMQTHNQPANSRVYGEFRRIEDAEERAASSVTLRVLAEAPRSSPPQTPPPREGPPSPEQRSLTE